MPIYEYKCSSCDALLEKLQKISDPELKECPECKQNTLKKQISKSAFRLNGTGWYETDFKDGPKKNLKSNDNKESKSKAEPNKGKDKETKSTAIDSKGSSTAKTKTKDSKKEQ